MRDTWGLILLFLAPTAYADEAELHLESLLSPKADVRSLSEAEFRARLTSENVPPLLEGMEELSPSLQHSVIRILSSGGPWMPAVVAACGMGEPQGRVAASILKNALERRPIRRELPESGEAAIRIIDPFSNSRKGEGAALYFPGTWPGRISLEAFLDRINDETPAMHPFVLRPDLAGDPALALWERPLEGPAPLVMDRVLSRLGLGITYLETVALIEPEGGSCFNQTWSERKRDALLLDKALSILADPGESEQNREAALKGLAYLDLPGLFDGYCGELARGIVRPALDMLLFGFSIHRLSAEVIEGRDIAKARILADLYLSPDGRGRVGPHLHERLGRFLFTFPLEFWEEVRPGFKELKCEEILSMLEDPDKARVKMGIEYAIMHAPSRPGLADALVERFSRWPHETPEITRRIEQCLSRSLTHRLDDEEVAKLIDNPTTRIVGLELAKTLGGGTCLDSVERLILEEGGGDPKSVRCGTILVKRRELEGYGERLHKILIDPGITPGSRTGAAGWMAALSDGGADDDRAAACLLEVMEKGGEGTIQAIRMLTFFREGRIRKYLGRIQSFAKGGDSRIREEVEKAVLGSVGSSSLAASRIRLALKRDEEGETWKELNDSLALLAYLTSLDSWRVAVDF